MDVFKRDSSEGGEVPLKSSNCKQFVNSAEFFEKNAQKGHLKTG